MSDNTEHNDNHIHTLELTCDELMYLHDLCVQQAMTLFQVAKSGNITEEELDGVVDTTRFLALLGPKLLDSLEIPVTPSPTT